jgi:two-component system chemotaxis sensor kinase CheA
MAIPLHLVARLEEFPRSVLEHAGTQDVVQYRDEILPLVHVSRVLRRRHRAGRNGKAAKPRAEGAETAADDTVQVVVYAGKGRRVGLVVGRILDIVEETLGARSPANRPGVLFTAVVQRQVTEFLDIEGIIRSADPEFYGHAPAVAAEA